LFFVAQGRTVYFFSSIYHRTHDDISFCFIIAMIMIFILHYSLSKFCEEWVFIEHIVEVSDFPGEGGLVVDGEHLQEVKPSEITLEAYHVLSVFLISATEKN
jgi:hypothetical protein